MDETRDQPPIPDPSPAAGDASQGRAPRDPCDGREPRRSLVRLERALRVPGLRDLRHDEDVTRDLDRLRGHLDDCARCVECLGGRFRAVEGLISLRQRNAPERLFHGFYEGVRQRAPLVPPGGAMSVAFLDVPRALHVWRSTALAATVLFAVGLGLLATREPAAGTADAGRSGRPLADPRGELLPSWTEAGSPWRGDSFLLRPARNPRSSGHPGFFGSAVIPAPPSSAEPEPEPEPGSAPEGRVPGVGPVESLQPKPRWD